MYRRSKKLYDKKPKSKIPFFYLGNAHHVSAAHANWYSLKIENICILVGKKATHNPVHYFVAENLGISNFF